LSNNNIDLVTSLLIFNADPNYIANIKHIQSQSMSLLHFAIQQNVSSDIIILLIKKGASLEAKDIANKTPLEYVTDSTLREKILNLNFENGIQSLTKSKISSSLMISKDAHNINPFKDKEPKDELFINGSNKKQKNSEVTKNNSQSSHTQETKTQENLYACLDNIEIKDLDSEDDLDKEKEKSRYLDNTNPNTITNTTLSNACNTATTNNKYNINLNNINQNKSSKRSSNASYNNNFSVAGVSFNSKERDNRDAIDKSSVSRTNSMNQLSDLNPLDTNKYA